MFRLSPKKTSLKWFEENHFHTLTRPSFRNQHHRGGVIKMIRKTPHDHQYTYNSTTKPKERKDKQGKNNFYKTLTKNLY